MLGICEHCRRQKPIERRTYPRPGDAHDDSPDRKQIVIELMTCDECDAIAPDWLGEHFRRDR
jgi:hypothetical protein